MSSSQNTLFERAARGETTERTPVWLMRQAGRTDPEYLRLRDSVDLPLEDLFRHPELATRISLLPERFGVDAIIYYQDILTPLTPMGAHFLFRPGPVLETPLAKVEAVERLGLYDVRRELPFIRETFEGIHRQLNGRLPVLGFAGAPLTLAVFILEGKSFGHQAPAAMAALQSHPEVVHRLLDRLTTMTIDYLAYQIESGAAAVQLFESAAFLLRPDQYREFALPYQRRIFSALKGTAPTINFAREWASLEDLDAADADIISLPSSISISEARSKLGPHRVFQGNVDNQLVASGPIEAIREAVRTCIADGGRHGHILNLNHGLLRETPQEHVLAVVQAAKDAG